VPLQQLLVDVVELLTQLAIFSGMRREELTRETGNRHVDRNPVKERLDFTHALRRSETELGGIAAYRVAELGPVSDQSFSHPNQHQ
jgi:hypothetical protein